MTPPTKLLIDVVMLAKAQSDALHALYEALDMQSDSIADQANGFEIAECPDPLSHAGAWFFKAQMEAEQMQQANVRLVRLFYAYHDLVNLELSAHREALALKGAQS